LLHRRHAKWALILCSGDGIKTVEGLRQAGVPPDDAAALARRLADAEGGLSPERLALFAKFEGTVMMDGSGHHPPVQQAQMQHAPQHMPAARTFKIGDIVIEAPWVRATPQGAQVAGGFMKITNTGKEPDRLVGGMLDHASRFEIHETTMVDNVAKMRPLPNGLEIKPGATIELKPGGFHVMGMELHGGYTQGQTIKGSLIFDKAGTVSVEYVVGPMGGPAPHG
jgi:copper(I)-binding protein